MHPPQFTLASLVAVVAICGVGFAALNGNHLWFSGLFTATIILIDYRSVRSKSSIAFTWDRVAAAS
jgi:hypothetical protein